ncbi:HAD family hydrolase [Ferrovibrio terrae]|uniref:D,D-heptose 1,7-bisphosphate phosphatase n=1 Tax=Ferrovibrio terrae TaxID=2594003 RepID=A0A516GXU4_9PROT|nr:HAD family hydrolase [Ferrovibrio terrae]QDO96351.1 HAD family hydrolase [Ferrovibrio terrae]
MSSSRAVFLDRDGVINRNVYYASSGEWEAPRHPDDLAIAAGAMTSIRQLNALGFRLFIVTNQPSFAKGKCSLDDLKAVQARVEALIAESGGVLTESFVCFHHPDGVEPGYSGPCECRKPSPASLLEAARRFNIDLGRSWMVGDRETDVACGHAAGVRTIRIAPDHPVAATGISTADYQAADLAAAVADIIVANADRK